VFKHSKLTNTLELSVFNKINKIISWHLILMRAFRSVSRYKQRLQAKNIPQQDIG